MVKEKKCEVIVGNVGTVESDVSLIEAKKTYNKYVKISKEGSGRAGREPIALLCDGDIISEYIPKGYVSEDYES